MPEFSSISEFFEYLIEARFGFKTIWEALVNLYYSVTQNPDISDIWTGFMNAIEPALKVLPFIIMVIGVVICLFGKKIMGILKFVAFFALGFVLGVYFLAPVIPAEIPIPAWVVGLVIAIISAVLYKFLYIIVYSVAVLYSVYRLCYYGFFLIEAPEYSTGKMLTSLAVAAIVLVLSFILFKFVEMLITSALGSWLLVSGFSMAFVDLGTVLGEHSWILKLCIFAVLALVSFVFQVKTRRRY